ncbi:MAG: AAA family ATPase [Ilumatobacteraceae bacterium]
MPEVIGRRREVTAAVAHLGRAAATGQAQLLLVEGVAGIGKSTVLDAISAELDTQGFRSVRVALTAAETSLSWAGLITLSRQFDPAGRAELPAAQRVALDGVLGGDTAGSVEPTLAAAGLAGIIAADVDVHGPMLLIVDDVQWLDHASAAALSFAVRVLASLPVAVVFASRPERRPLEPERLLPSDRSLRIGLEGLSLVELQELLAARFGVVHRRPVLIRLHEACGGNVMHAIEVGRMLSEGHSLDVALVPQTLRALIDGELARLPDEVAEALEHVALLPRPTVALVERVLPGAESGLAAAEQLGILAERDGRLLFAHPLLRAGLLDRIGGVRRRRLERALAEVVEDPEERVVLRAAAATGIDVQIAAELEAIGERAAALGATHVAAVRFDRSVELTPADDHGARARRLLSAGLAHTRAGDLERGAPRFAAAIAAGLPPLQDAWAVISLTTLITERDGPHASVEWLTAAAERLRGDGLAHLRLVLWRVLNLLFADLRGARAAAPAALAAARDWGDPEFIAQAAIITETAAYLSGETVDVDRLQALLPAAPLAAATANGVVPVYLGQLLVWSDRVDASIANERTELDRALAAGHIPAEANALQSISDAYRRCGRWDDACAAMERWTDLVALTGSDPALEGSYSDLAWLWAMRGRCDDAMRRAATAVEQTKTNPIWHLHSLANAGMAAAVCGHQQLAAEHLAAACALAEQVGFGDLCSLQFRDTWVEVLLALGRVEEGAAEAVRITELAHRAQRPRGLVQAARSRAMVAAAKGDLDEATAALDEAMHALDGFADPFERGRTLLVSGVIARRAGRRTESREQLEAARRLFESLRAVPFVERVDAELQRLGARTGRTDLLTHGELQVAQLVCDGRTNAEVAAALFITPRTVEAHLTRVYRKVGVRSRAELIARRSLLDA